MAGLKLDAMASPRGFELTAVKGTDAYRFFNIDVYMEK
jgi:hypothetical protein